MLCGEPKRIVIDNAVVMTTKEVDMKNKSEIVELLTSKFSSVYCDTCDPTGIDWEWDDEKGEEVPVEKKNANCEDCYRKKMNWGLSKETAERLAEEILL